MQIWITFLHRKSTHDLCRNTCDSALSRPYSILCHVSRICFRCNCLVDDVAAVNHLATIIEDNYCIDMSREYITGFSQGGMLTHTAACQLADRFAAAAPFHGVRHIGFECAPKKGYTMPIFQTWYAVN